LPYNSSFHVSVPRVYYTLFRSAYFFNFDLGVPDDIGRVQGILAVKKVKNHCCKGSSNGKQLGAELRGLAEITLCCMPHVSLPVANPVRTVAFRLHIRAICNYNRLPLRNDHPKTAAVCKPCLLGRGVSKRRR